MTLSLSELAARRLRRDVSVEEGEAEYTERRSRLVRAATKGRGRRHLWRWLLLALAGGSFAGWYAVTIDRAASFSAAGEPGRIGAFYTAPAGAPLLLRFGDGSQVRLTSGSHARVLGSEVGRRAVVLEAGRAETELRQQRGWTWDVSAGPFLIESSHADLDLSWDVPAQTLVVNLRAGSLLVRGPGLGSGRSLSGSQQFTAKVPASQP